MSAANPAPQQESRTEETVYRNSAGDDRGNDMKGLSVQFLDASRASGSSQDSAKGGSIDKRIESQREVLGIEHDEEVVDVYMCALKDRVLHQGRLIVFERHICFHSVLFGHRKNVTLACSEITEVKRARNVGFPNSIVIRTRGGTYFFTSFLSREDALEDIIAHVPRATVPRRAPHAPPSSGRLTSVRGVLHAAQTYRPSKIITRALSHKSEGRQDADADADADGDGRGASGAVGPRSTRSDASLGSHLGSGVGSDSEDEEDGSVVADDDSVLGMSSFVVASDPGALETLGLGSLSAPPAPPRDPAATKASEFELDCSVFEFWDLFLANPPSFWTRFHRKLGDDSVRLTNWQKHDEVGLIRDLTFVTPLKVKMGPDKTLCSQSHHATAHAGGMIIFQTSQVMADIPYADHFTVETRWEVAPIAAAGGGDGVTVDRPSSPSSSGRCSIRIYVAVPFSKKTMWRTFIEKGAREGVVGSYKTWIELAQAEVKRVRNGSVPTSLLGRISAGNASGVLHSVSLQPSRLAAASSPRGSEPAADGAALPTGTGKTADSGDALAPDVAEGLARGAVGAAVGPTVSADSTAFLAGSPAVLGLLSAIALLCLLIVLLQLRVLAALARIQLQTS